MQEVTRVKRLSIIAYLKCGDSLREHFMGSFKIVLEESAPDFRRATIPSPAPTLFVSCLLPRDLSSIMKTKLLLLRNEPTGPAFVCINRPTPSNAFSTVKSLLQN